MSIESGRTETVGAQMNNHDFYRRLYDDKAEYVARRDDTSFEASIIQLEVDAFKVPNLIAAIPPGFNYSSVVEIGCATGELLAAFPVPAGARKVGFDISSENVACARLRHPDIEFFDSDFREFDGLTDIVVLSDVLEHVPDDRGMLRDAGRLGRLVLINLPLEDNWLNRARAYGPDDVSGHLRRYSLDEGMALVESAGLRTLQSRQVWIHETECDQERRRLRRQALGAAFSGGRMAAAAKQCVWSAATLMRPVGRRMFASNLFVSASRREAP
jgi:SAM-dependent methyltransferase